MHAPTHLRRRLVCVDDVDWQAVEPQLGEELLRPLLALHEDEHWGADALEGRESVQWVTQCTFIHVSIRVLVRVLNHLSTRELIRVLISSCVHTYAHT